MVSTGRLAQECLVPKLISRHDEKDYSTCTDVTSLVGAAILSFSSDSRSRGKICKLLKETSTPSSLWGLELKLVVTAIKGREIVFKRVKLRVRLDSALAFNPDVGRYVGLDFGGRQKKDEATARHSKHMTHACTVPVGEEGSSRERERRGIAEQSKAKESENQSTSTTTTPALTPNHVNSPHTWTIVLQDELSSADGLQDTITHISHVHSFLSEG
jgi:hypothetical protein